jgi:hypothetical protein
MKNFMIFFSIVFQLLRKDRCRLVGTANKDYSKSNGSVPSKMVRCATIGSCSYSDKNKDIAPGRLGVQTTCCGGVVDGATEAETDTQNLDAFIAWFRRLAMYVASEICKVSRFQQ